MTKRITHEEIDCIRRIGRDEVGRVMTIGLNEIDALCDDADFLLDRVAELERAQRTAALPECVVIHRRDWRISQALGDDPNNTQAVLKWVATAPEGEVAALGHCEERSNDRLALADAVLASEKQLVKTRAERDEASSRADTAEQLALGLGELVMRHWSTRSPMRRLPADWAKQVEALREKWKEGDGDV